MNAKERQQLAERARKALRGAERAVSHLFMQRAVHSDCPLWQSSKRLQVDKNRVYRLVLEGEFTRDQVNTVISVAIEAKVAADRVINMLEVGDYADESLGSGK